jgi:DNA-binding NtrC family response regulator
MGRHTLPPTGGGAFTPAAAEPQASLSLAALGRSPLINELKTRLERIANLRTPVLLVAEPGCGVELCARSLHARNTPWVSVESTAKLADAPLDLLASAREGTLFFHDVAELSRIEQRGLLLLVSKLDRYNARVIAGATRQLAELVASGAFDSRLYAALSATAIRVPSLREHREDVPDIANLVLSQMIEAKEVPPREFSIAALNALRHYDWPGNLTQLQTTVQTLAQTALGDEITLDDVERVLPQADPARTRSQDLPFDLPLRDARDAFERVYFEYHIAKEGGNISRVADTVGLERTHLYRKLKQLGIRVSRRPEEQGS